MTAGKLQANKNRINFFVSDKMREDLASMRSKTGMSQSEIVRRSISLMTVVSNENDDDNVLAIADSSGNVVKQIVIDV